MILIVSDGEPVVPRNEPVIQVGAGAQSAIVYRFNAANLDSVAQMKLLAAAMIQLVRDDRTRSGFINEGGLSIAAQAEANIMTACMWGVRCLTDGR